MGVLSGPEIVRIRNRTVYQDKVRGAVADGEDSLPPILPRLTIEPFDEKLAGPNSYDVHLSDQLKVYSLRSVAQAHPQVFFDVSRAELRRQPDLQDAVWGMPDVVDAKNPPGTTAFKIPASGFVLYPGVLYLGATVERTLCEGLVPWLDGRSSVGRLGLSLHVTAGRGDDGWPGRWTLEITAVTHPVKVYPGMRCGQITFFTLDGERKPYEGRYRDQDGPTASRLHEEIDPKSKMDLRSDTEGWVNPRIAELTAAIEMLPGLVHGVVFTWCKKHSQKHHCELVNSMQYALDTLRRGEPLPLL